MTESLIFVIAALVVVAVNTRRASDGHVAAFADAYRLELTPTNVEPLRSLVLRSRRFRWVGAGVASIADAIWRSTPGMWELLGAIAVGFAIGSIADELLRPTERSGSIVAASLERRTARTYVERWVIAATLVMFVVVIGQAAMALQIDRNTELTIDTGWILARVAAVACAALFAGIAVRRIVQAPALTGPTELQAMRHAVRMAGVLSVFGAVNIIAGAAALSLVDVTALNDNSLARWLQWVNNFSLLLAALGFYYGIATSLQAFPKAPWFKELAPVPAATTGGTHR